MYVEKDQHDNAIDVFSTILKRSPNDHRVRYLLASTLEEKKAHTQAIDQIKMIPMDSELYGNSQIGIGVILKKEGKIDEATAVLTRAIQNNKKKPELYVYLSSLYEEK